jgi:hypothetical protein
MEFLRESALIREYLPVQSDFNSLYVLKSLSSILIPIPAINQSINQLIKQSINH